MPVQLNMPRLLSLFDGTGSIRRPFAEAGWDVQSVDLDARHGATDVCDVREWDYRSAHAPDVIWAGVPCEQYSIARTRAKKPRDYATADSLVAKTWEIIQHFLQIDPALLWFVENPMSSQLWRRSVADVFAVRSVLSYCSYQSPVRYQKKTRIAHNTAWEPRPICSAKTCEYYGRHPKTAQKGPTKGWRGAADECSLCELHAYPRQLCEEIFQYCQARVWHEVSP